LQENGLNGKKQADLGAARVVEPTQLNETAEEVDDDETGVEGSFEVTSRPGLKNLFGTWSNSKFARARRGKANLPPGISEPKYWIKDQGPLKVEGKVWLANQRTYIKWQHVSVLLAGLSLGLYNAAGKNNDIARALAVAYTIIALFTAAWGYGVYIWRTHLIERRSGKDFDAITGPIVVCVGLIVALVLNFAFKVSGICIAASVEHDLLTFPAVSASRQGAPWPRPHPASSQHDYPVRATASHLKLSY
jgi:hypothetical protein